MKFTTSFNPIILIYNKVAIGPPLWSSGQSFWLQIQRSWVRFPALPDFLRSSRSGTGSTQPREDNWGATWKKQQRLRSRKPRLTTGGNRCADHATPSIRKSWHVFANKWRSLGWHSSLANKSPEFFLKWQLRLMCQYHYVVIQHKHRVINLFLINHAKLLLFPSILPWG
jgi:hypothetical protein